MYEPVYVSKADTPIFDERFIGFGMTRNTQVVKTLRVSKMVFSMELSDVVLLYMLTL